MAREKIKLTSYDELLGVSKDRTIDVDVAKLHEFKNHPFKVIDDSKMDELVQSIKENGVLSPALVRELPNGEYELISGHRRKRACEIVGITKMPVIVKQLSDDEATIIMVDSNIQREEILPTEKAYAFKMKLAAMSHQGKRVERIESSAGAIGEEEGISMRQVQRYIRLTQLIPELQEMVDDKMINFVTGVSLSFIPIITATTAIGIGFVLDYAVCLLNGNDALKKGKRPYAGKAWGNNRHYSCWTSND